MTGEERVCPACHGSQVGPWDRNEGRSMPCRHCDGSGRVVTCLECACDVAAPERRRWATTAPAAELTSTGRPE